MEKPPACTTGISRGRGGFSDQTGAAVTADISIPLRWSFGRRISAFISDTNGSVFSVDLSCSELSTQGPGRAAIRLKPTFTGECENSFLGEHRVLRAGSAACSPGPRGLLQKH